MNQEIYNEDYFERGEKLCKSCYTNYKWLPDLTIPMAQNIIAELKLNETDKVLDYGCAKGYLVKALRHFNIKAFGCDISRYAFENRDAEIERFCMLITDEQNSIPFMFDFDWLITKDVLEHLTEKELAVFLKQIKGRFKHCFHIIPLGDELTGFAVPEYDKDITHKLARSYTWWIKQFVDNGWKIKTFSFTCSGIKEKWTTKYPNGNGFFTFEKI